LLRSGGDFVQIANGSNGTLNNTITLNNSSGSNLYRVHVRVLSNHTVTTTGSFTYNKRSFAWHYSADVNENNHDRVRFYPHNTIPDIRVARIGTRTITNNGVTRTFNQAYVENFTRNGINDWNSGTEPVPCRFVNGLGETGADIFIRAGRASWILERWDDAPILINGAPNRVANGAVSYGSAVTVSTQTINNRQRSIRIPYRSSNVTIIYLVNKKEEERVSQGGRAYLSDERSDIGHRNTLNHEIGHALGYMSHSSNSSDLMRGSGTSNTAIVSASLRDRDHITQFRRAHHYNGTL